MNIKEFLIDNYIWIIVIILITVITIIGFLADKNRNNKKKAPVPTQDPNNMNNQQLNNMGQMQYNGIEQPMKPTMNNNTNVVQNANNQMSNMNQNVNENIQNNQTMNNFNNQMASEQPMQTTIPTGINEVNNPTPVENIVPNTQAEPMYQPLSEQKPVIPPQQIPNFSNMNNQETVVPTQGNIMNQNIQNNIPQVSQSNFGQPTPQLMNQQVPSQPMNQENNLNQNQNYNIPTPMAQQIANNGSGNMPNYNQNNTTIPQPVMPIPTPQPVKPQPILQGNNNKPMQNNYAEPMNQGIQPQIQQMPNPSINFVYGQTNNNQNM